jgi:hypothetical protein
LLSVPPLLLSCDLAAADFWRVSAAAEQLQQQRPKRPRVFTDTLPAEAAPVTALLGAQRLVPAKRPRMISRPVMQLLAGTAAAVAAGGGAGSGGAGKGKLEEAKPSGAGAATAGGVVCRWAPEVRRHPISHGTRRFGGHGAWPHAVQWWRCVP